MLYREIIAVCSQIHTKHINTVCGQNVELLNVKPAVHIVTTGIQRMICSQLSHQQLRPPSPNTITLLYLHLLTLHLLPSSLTPCFHFVHFLFAFISCLYIYILSLHFPPMFRFILSLLSLLRVKKSVFLHDLPVGHANHVWSFSASEPADQWSQQLVRLWAGATSSQKMRRGIFNLL